MPQIEPSTLELDDLLRRIAAKLQITPDQHQNAEQHYTAIGTWLEAEGSLLRSAGPSIYVQGSLQLGTTVKPLRWNEYDVDLVCELRTLDWRTVRSPVDLLNAVEARLRQHGIYAGMLEKKNRCLRLNYAGQFHLDVLPACPDPDSGAGCVLVPDRNARDWRSSNPQGYVAWFDSRAKLFDSQLFERMAPPPSWQPADVKPPLKVVVQLFKRWRDLTYRQEMNVAPASILLTTLSGELYQGEQSIGNALGLVLKQIARMVDGRKERLLVMNPSNRQEDLSERWDDSDEYALFCSRIRAFHVAWQELQNARGAANVAARLNALFGEEVTTHALTEHAEAVNKARNASQLGVRSASGRLGAVTAGSSVLVRPNTFYGG